MLRLGQIILLSVGLYSPLIAAEPDLFDTIGQSPEQIAQELAKLENGPFGPQVATPFTGWPMTEVHRSEFVENLRFVSKPARTRGFALDTLLDVLEEQSRFEEALREIPIDVWTEDRRFQARKVGLLWKEGKTDAAIEAAAQITGGPRRWECWFATVSVDIANGRAERAVEMLGFLLNHVDLNIAEHAALRQRRIDLVWQTGSLDSLLSQQPDGAGKAYDLMLLDRQPEALTSLRAAGPIRSGRDLALLASLSGLADALAESCRIYLEDPKLSAESRADLLNAIPDETQRLQYFLRMPQGHAETLKHMKFTADWRSKSPWLSLPTCASILSQHPEDPALNLLQGYLMESMASAPDRFSADRKSVHGYFKKSMGENGRTHFLAALSDTTSPKSYEPATFECPGISAIKELARSSEIAELDRLITSRPDYATLPDSVKLYRLMAAGLDFKVAAVFEECPFNQPDQDLVSGKLAEYFGSFSQTRSIPDSVARLIVRKLPELILGSPGKSSPDIASDSSRWFALLGPNGVSESAAAEALHQVYEAAIKRGGETPSLVLRRLPTSLQQLAKIPHIQPNPGVSPRLAREISPPWLKALGVFGPPQGNGTYRSEELLARANTDWRFQTELPPLRSAPAIALMKSQWSGNMQCALQAMRGGEIAEMAEKLRELLPADARRAEVFDAMVARSWIACENQVVGKLAANHARQMEEAATPPEDPDLKAFLFLTRLLSSTRPEKELHGFPDLRNSPNFVRARIQGSLGNASRFLSRNSAVLEYFANQTTSTPRVVPPEAQRISPYEKFKLYEQNGQSASAACLSFAENVLDGYLETANGRTSPDENTAISILVRHGRFEAYLARVEERMKSEGGTEADVLRAFYRLHLYTIIHKNGEAMSYAKRIFALDPSDAEAAAVILHQTASEGDIDTLLKCLTALAAKSRSAFCAALPKGPDSQTSDPLDIRGLAGGNTPIIARHLLSLPPPPAMGVSNGGQDDLQNAMGFLRVLIVCDTKNFDPVLRWLGLDGGLQFEQLSALAEALSVYQNKDEAVRFLADKLLNPPSVSAAGAFRFPERRPLPITNTPQTIRLDDLEEMQLLKPLGAIAGTSPETPANRTTRALLAIGADPRPETWEQFGKPLLAGMTDAETRALTTDLGNMSNGSDAAAWIKPKLDQEMRGRLPANLATLDPASQIRIIAESTVPDRGQRITELWNRFISTAESRDENYKSNQYCAIALPIASAAEDAVWVSFLEVIRKLPQFGDQWIVRSSSIPTDTPRHRLREFAKVVLESSKPSSSGSQKMEPTFDVLMDDPETPAEMLAAFRPWLLKPGRHSESNNTPSWRVTWLDLLEGRIASIQPALDVVRTGDTTWNIGWSLASVGTPQGKAVLDAAFPLVDEKTNLTVLAGPDGRHLARAHTIDAARSRGRIEISAPADSACFVLMASEREGGAVRMSAECTPMDLRQWKELPLDTSGKLTGSHPTTGPFGTADATSLPIPANSRVTLGAVPWFGDEVPAISLWIRNPASEGSLGLELTNAAGDIIRKISLNHQRSYQCSKSWSLAGIETIRDVPPETHAVNLVFDASRITKPIEIAVSAVLAEPITPFSPPAGVRRLGKLPGRIARLALSMDENHLAVASEESGLGSFDLKSSEFSGWIPVSKPRQSGWRNSCSWLAMVHDRIARANGNGDVLVISMKDKRLIPVDFQPPARNADGTAQSFALSPDGRFIAKSATFAGLHIAHIAEDGTVKTRMLETPRLFKIGFDDSSSTLSAWTGSYLYRLRLAEWEKGLPQVESTGGRDRRWEFTEPLDQVNQVGNSGPRVIHRSQQQGSRFHMDSKSGAIYLPDGWSFLTRDNNLIVIDRMQWIYEVRTSELKGYSEFQNKER